MSVLPGSQQMGVSAGGQGRGEMDRFKMMAANTQPHPKQTPPQAPQQQTHREGIPRMATREEFLNNDIDTYYVGKR